MNLKTEIENLYLLIENQDTLINTMSNKIAELQDDYLRLKFYTDKRNLRIELSKLDERIKQTEYVSGLSVGGDQYSMLDV
jgi:hypothetical protein|tara:strand:- start:491 stop:730 length:240 start_codon:yes stop_codon:yes gene_type:complete